MKFKDKQFLFAKLEAKLIQYMIDQGFNPIKGYCFRCKDCPVGKKNSLHKLCLASDIELYAPDGETYLTKTKDHRLFGRYWKSLHPLCRWGGDFKNKDGNHYSITHNGIK